MIGFPYHPLISVLSVFFSDLRNGKSLWPSFHSMAAYGWCHGRACLPGDTPSKYHEIGVAGSVKALAEFTNYQMFRCGALSLEDIGFDQYLNAVAHPGQA